MDHLLWNPRLRSLARNSTLRLHVEVRKLWLCGSTRPLVNNLSLSLERTPLMNNVLKITLSLVRYANWHAGGVTADEVTAACWTGWSMLWFLSVLYWST
jgi:hypothetical protein